VDLGSKEGGAASEPIPKIDVSSLPGCHGGAPPKMRAAATAAAPDAQGDEGEAYALELSEKDLEALLSNSLALPAKKRKGPRSNTRNRPGETV